MIHIIENRILHEQLLQEAFLDSVKDYAKEKYNKTITTISDWKDLAVIMGKVISDPTVLSRFADDVWRNFKNNTLKKLTDFLERIGLNDLIAKIKSVVDKITNLSGWKKLLAASGIGAMINYVVEKMTGLAPDAIKVFLQKYVSEKGLGEILSKLTDFKSYVGWLQPIIKGVDMLYDVLKSSINKFKSQANLFTQSINLIKKEGMSSKIKLKEKLTSKLKQEMSTTGTGASVTPGVGAGVATKYAFAPKKDGDKIAKDYIKTFGGKLAPSVPNRPSKVMDYKELWEAGEYDSLSGMLAQLGAEEDAVKVLVKAVEMGALKPTDAVAIVKKTVNLQEGYAQFRNETKMRSKPDQFHQAVKQVKKKVNEINRLFEYMDRLKTELSEGEAIKNKKYTDNAIHQIKEETKKLFFKAIKLK
jgi:hypothetical protein